MASSSDAYSRAPNGSGIPSLTDFPRGKDRSWIHRQPPSLFGTRPSGEDIKGGAGWPITFVSLLWSCCFCRSFARISGAARADG